MPRPARSTGISSGGLLVRTPVVVAAGVRTVISPLPGRVPGRLVDEHCRQLAQGGPEGRVVGALVAHHGQPGCGKRMFDELDVHEGTVVRGRAAPSRLSGGRRRPISVACSNA